MHVNGGDRFLQAPSHTYNDVCLSIVIRRASASRDVFSAKRSATTAVTSVMRSSSRRSDASLNGCQCVRKSKWGWGRRVRQSISSRATRGGGARPERSQCDCWAETAGIGPSRWRPSRLPARRRTPLSKKKILPLRHLLHPLVRSLFRSGDRAGLRGRRPTASPMDPPVRSCVACRRRSRSRRSHSCQRRSG